MNHRKLCIGVRFSRGSLAHARGLGTVAVSALAFVGAVVGCSGRGSDAVESSKAALNANPQTTDFAVYAQNSASLTDRVGVTGGDVGVRLAGTGPFLGGAYELTMIADSHVDSARSVLANRLLLRDRARAGDIQVNQVTNSNNGIFAHRYTFPANMPALPPVAPVTPGTSALTVNMSATVVANPGSYAAVSVRDKGILRLKGGVYQIASLQIGNDARLEALAPVQVRIAGLFGTLDRIYIGAAAGVTLNAGDLRIEVSGKNGASGSLTDSPKAAAFGNGANVKAVMLVPNGTLMSGQRAVVVGAYVAKDVYMDLDSSITYQSGVGPSGCLQSCDDGNPCTNDACSVGVCVHSPSRAGTSCADGNACNGAEGCDGAGHCQAGTPVVCTALDQCHTVGVCDTTTGLCSNPAKPNGTACDDANRCTKTDACTAGVCGGTAYTCDDGLSCTADSCNGDGTCTFAVTTGNCLVGGVCYASATTNPGNQCEQCTPETSNTAWSPEPVGTACDDGNVCTMGDICDGASTCGGTAYSCNDGLTCTADSCNGDGTCSYTIIAGSCAINGTCYAAGTTNPANQCQTCAPSLNTTNWTAKPTGTACNDGNACTSNDICTASVCGGTAYSCDDGLACTGDSCNGDGTCNHTIVGGSCLINGACYANGAGNPASSCQICDSAQATTWTNQADGTTCNACAQVDGGADDGGTSLIDGGICSSHTCIAGACTGECVPGQQDCVGLVPRICDATGNWQNQPSCDDGNPCTTDFCSTGRCTNITVTDGTACNDGNACHLNDTCQAGVCTAGLSFTCPSGESCVFTPQPCVPTTCAALGLNCGPVGDGCGGQLDCGGSCPVNQVCGGGGTPGVCGPTPVCTGLCLQQVTCPGTATTTVSGTIFAPNGRDPIFNALVYVPNGPVLPFAPNVACQQCGDDVSGSPLVSTYSAANGTFTLTNVPVGSNIPIVIQLGRWRRQLTLPSVAACTDNTEPGTFFRLPARSSEGDIPLIALVTGSVDSIECVLRKVGINDSEFTAPSATGRVQIYLGNGATLAGGVPNETVLYSTQTTIDRYDMTIFACEGTPTSKTAAQEQILVNYANAGGRVFATHYNYTWFNNTAPFSGTATWHVQQSNPTSPVTALVDMANPQAASLVSWLTTVGASTTPGQISITSARRDFDAVNAAEATRWLYWTQSGQQIPLHYTFDTPVGSPTAQQCGRALYSDFHVDEATSSGIFPSECNTAAMTPQEHMLEFMLFDLSSCVNGAPPATCSPLTCTQQGISCGPAGDGCGNPLDCGSCTNPQTCGGGGVPGVCGNPYCTR